MGPEQHLLYICRSAFEKSVAYKSIYRILCSPLPTSPTDVVGTTVILLATQRHCVCLKVVYVVHAREQHQSHSKMQSEQTM